jgi:hypothetical protein
MKDIITIFSEFTFDSRMLAYHYIKTNKRKKKEINMRTKLTILLCAPLLSMSVYAGNIDGNAVFSSMLGAGVGSAVGSVIGGRDGAIIGGGVGGVIGAAAGSRDNYSRDVIYEDHSRPVVVRTTNVVVQDRYYRPAREVIVFHPRDRRFDYRNRYHYDNYNDRYYGEHNRDYNDHDRYYDRDDRDRD